MNEALAMKAIDAAKKNVANNVPMKSSALSCLSDAESLFEVGNFFYAHKRALKSLAYSVGVFSAVYQDCNAHNERAKAIQSAAEAKGLRGAFHQAGMILEGSDPSGGAVDIVDQLDALESQVGIAGNKAA